MTDETNTNVTLTDNVEYDHNTIIKHLLKTTTKYVVGTEYRCSEEGDVNTSFRIFSNFDKLLENIYEITKLEYDIKYDENYYSLHNNTIEYFICWADSRDHYYRKTIIYNLKEDELEYISWYMDDRKIRKE